MSSLCTDHRYGIALQIFFGLFTKRFLALYDSLFPE
jgi:hypothetical protein